MNRSTTPGEPDGERTTLTLVDDYATPIGWTLSGEPLWRVHWAEGDLVLLATGLHKETGFTVTDYHTGWVVVRDRLSWLPPLFAVGAIFGAGGVEAGVASAELPMLVGTLGLLWGGLLAVSRAQSLDSGLHV